MFILTKKTTPFGTISKPNIKIAERGTFDTPNTQIHDCSLYWLDISNTQIHARSLYWLDTSNTQIHVRSLYWIYTGTSIKGIINGSLINLIWSNLMYASHQYVVPKTMVKNNCIDSSLIARKTILYFEMSR